jgi:hypothetical protein
MIREVFLRHSGESRNPATPLAFGLFERRILTLKSDKSLLNHLENVWTPVPRLKPEGTSFTGESNFLRSSSILPENGLIP